MRSQKYLHTLLCLVVLTLALVYVLVLDRSKSIFPLQIRLL